MLFDIFSNGFFVDAFKSAFFVSFSICYFDMLYLCCIASGAKLRFASGSMMILSGIILIGVPSEKAHPHRSFLESVQLSVSPIIRVE